MIMQNGKTLVFRLIAVLIAAMVGACGGGAGGANDSVGTVPMYTVSGTLSGLPAGNVIDLRNNGIDDVTLGANGPFTFPDSIANNAPYSVAIAIPPVGANCTVSNGTGTIQNAHVTNVAVACVAVPTYTVSGTLSGLPAGTTVDLLNNGANELTLTANGTFTFATPQVTGTPYSVTVGIQPDGATCSVANGTGTIGTANVTNVAVTCSINPTFAVSGTLSGLPAGDSIDLQNNGSDFLTLVANGPFTFPLPVANNSPYSVSVFLSPAGATCTVSNGTGTITNANVTNVAVTCTAAGAFTVSGTLSGLPAGDSLDLQNNGTDFLTLVANGPFTFLDPVAANSPYSVSVFVPPADATCTVANGTGIITNASVTNIAVTCSAAAAFTVSGTLSGLPAGETIDLQNNGAADDLVLAANGPFTFATPLPSNSAYSVTVLVPPVGATCTVTNGTGIIVNANVTNVGVTCTVP